MENTELNKYNTFEVDMMNTGRLNNLFCGFAFFGYTLYSSGIMKIMTTRELLVFVGIVVISAIVGQFIIAPYTNRFIVKDISDGIEKNRGDGLTTEERTELLTDILNCPKKICLEVGLVMFGISIIPFLYLAFSLNISVRTGLYIFCCCAAGIYFSGIMALCYSENLCCKIATSLIEEGIDAKKIHEKRFFGTSTRHKAIFFSIFPILICAFLQSSILYMMLYDRWDAISITCHFGFILVFNCILVIIVSGHMQRTLTSNTFNIIEVLEKLIKNQEMELFLPTDLNTEISYNIFLIDEVITYLHDISRETVAAGKIIATASQQLSETANLSARTSISEATAIRQCLATMENAKNQHKRISAHIDLIQKSAALTKTSADTSSELLSSGLEKMSGITQSNLDTIYGIKDLSDKIESINEIVESIYAVAEHTKSIAFNAELKASIAGERGEKFHIVSTEILRLAADINSSIVEIKNRITDILHSCDNLIISSESGTQKTKEGTEFYTNLERNFRELRISSDITAESLRKIVDITDVQQEAFEQINSTLAEINSGFEQFSQASQRLSLETKALRETAVNLGFSAKNSNGGNK